MAVLMPVLPGYPQQLLRAAKAARLVAFATLTRRTSTGRTTGQPSAGTNLSPTTFNCYVQVDDFSSHEMGQNTNIVQGDKKISVYGASLQPGIEPTANDEITVEGKARRVIALLSRDAAAALYLCQCRG